MEKLIVTSAYNKNEVLKELEMQSKEEITKSLTLAKETFEDKSKWLPKYKRVEILEKTISIMQNREEELIKIATQEGGKPYIDSKVEVQRAINGVKLAIEHLGAFEGKEIAMGHTKSSENRMAYTFREPIGVVISISAFNHPLNLAVHQTIPAIAVGSPVILKPAETTPLSAINFVNILYEAGLPKEWCQIIICNIPNAEYLATHQFVDYLSFIGSAKVGWYLRSKVSEGTRVGLEHGGVAPLIVEKDAKIDEIAPAIAKGGFYHAGQVCVSVQRVYLHKDIFDQMAEKLTQIAKSLKVGDPLDETTEIGPLILDRELIRVQEWVEDAKNRGADILCGGEKIGESCYAPTILANPSKETNISCQEVFAPLIALYSYEDINEAIKEANSTPFSFQASIFTQDIDKALKVVKEINATTVMVNDHTAFRVDWMPFGGAKSSGLGMGGISYSMEEMSKEKLMVIKSPSI